MVFCQTLTLTTATVFHVAVTPVTQQRQSFQFETGAGVPGTVVKVVVYDKCRTELSSESDFRTIVGELYPASTVQGIAVDHSGVAADPVGNHSNVLSFTFAEGIAQNYDIYHTTTTSTTTDATGKVEFCVQVNLYSGEYLANFAELKLTYNINLKTDVVAAQEQTPNRGLPVKGIASLSAPAGTAEDPSYKVGDNSTNLTTETSLIDTGAVNNNDTTTTQTVRNAGPFRHLLRLTEPPLSISTARMTNEEVQYRKYETKTTFYLLSAIMIFFFAVILTITMVKWVGSPKVVKEANPAVARSALAAVDTSTVGVVRVPIQRILRGKTKRSSTMDETIPSTSGFREKSRLRRSNTALYKHLQQEGMPPH